MKPENESAENDREKKRTEKQNRKNKKSMRQ